MTRQQAREILAAYRPGTADERDPAFAEARAFLAGDPELQAWFEGERAFDADARRRLRGVPVPDDLLERLLKAPAPVPRRFRPLEPRWLALAASLALLLTLAAFWLKPPPEPATPFAAYRQHLANWLRQFPPLDLETEKLAEARTWLAANGGVTQLDVPAGLARFPTLGCRRIEWQGRNAGLVCFMVDGDVMHLIVMAAPALEGAPAGAEPVMTRHGGFQTASWTRAGATYVVITRASAQALRRAVAS